MNKLITKIKNVLNENDTKKIYKIPKVYVSKSFLGFGKLKTQRSINLFYDELYNGLFNFFWNKVKSIPDFASDLIQYWNKTVNYKNQDTIQYYYDKIPETLKRFNITVIIE